MPKFRTHYDNLKVSRDAPIEVIQAAYRSLARKYHPDTNRSTTKGEATMKIINASYEVLSDPVKRAEHDRWIASQEERHLRTHENRSHAERSTEQAQIKLSTWILRIAYVALAIWMIRIPNLRTFGIVMLVGGWVLLKLRPKR